MRWNRALRRILQWYKLRLCVARQRDHMCPSELPELDNSLASREMQRQWNLPGARHESMHLRVYRKCLRRSLQPWRQAVQRCWRATAVQYQWTVAESNSLSDQPSLLRRGRLRLCGKHVRYLVSDVRERAALFRRVLRVRLDLVCERVL